MRDPAAPALDERRLVKALKALAHTSRFQIVREIASAGELCCGEIQERIQLAQPTISHHIKILDEAGVIIVRRTGPHAFISVDEGLVRHVLETVGTRLAPTAAPPDQPGSVKRQ